MKIQAETVTPETAAEWISASQIALLAASPVHANRRLNPVRVQVYADSMCRGEWLLTHQPVAFDPDGVIIDGQHRLAAVVKAGIPVQMLVARDVDPSTFAAIDVGQPRSAGQVLGIAGYGNGNHLAAAGRMLLVYERLAGSQARVMLPAVALGVTATELVRLVESARGDRLRASLTYGGHIATSMGRTGARTAITVANLLIEESGADLREEFFDALATGVRLDPSSPVLGLRRWYLGETGYVRMQSNQRTMIGVAATIKAWNLWLEGRTVQVFSFKAGVEPLPRPKTLVPLAASN